MSSVRIAPPADQRRAYWDELESQYHRSEIHNTLGLTLEVPEAGSTCVHYDGSSGATNRRGNPAGGALAEMADSAVVMAARTLMTHEGFTTTLEMKINYISSAEPGTAVVAEGRIDHMGKTTAVGTVRLFDSSRRLVALGTVTVAVRHAPASSNDQ